MPDSKQTTEVSCAANENRERKHKLDLHPVIDLGDRHDLTSSAAVNPILGRSLWGNVRLILRVCAKGPVHHLLSMLQWNA